MGELFIGGKRYEIESETGKSISDVIKLAAKLGYLDQNKVTGITVDGKEIDLNDEAGLDKMPYSHQKIIIDIDKVVDDAFFDNIVNQSMDYCTRLKEGFLELAEKIREDVNQSGFSMLKTGMEGLIDILNVVNLIQNQPDTSQDLRAKCIDIMKTTTVISGELTEAQESHDPILVADILEYEYLEIIDGIINILTQFNTEKG